MSIAENIQSVNERIKAAALRGGTKYEGITLVAVSKTVEVRRIIEAVEAGAVHLGENKPQELRDKFPLIQNAVWHQIGHLQTNKVKYIIDKAELIHSADSERLLDEINSQAEKINKVQSVLIQINVAREESKSGISADMLPAMLEHASKLENITVNGLMMIPPFSYSDDQLKKFYEICNKLFVDNSAKIYHNIDMKYLSMGMSGDYEIAVEAGANIVRIGREIFGARV